MPTSPHRSPRRPTRRHWISPLASLAMMLAACAGAGNGAEPGEPSAMPDHPDCHAPQRAPGTDPGSFEDASLIAAGEMFRVYGADADPVREQVTGETVTIAGVDAWKLDATITVTVDDSRRSDSWMLWVGFANDQLAVLCADGPADVAWPPVPRPA